MVKDRTTSFLTFLYLTWINCVRPGVLARVVDALQQSQDSPPYKSNLFSIAGSQKILSGSKDVTPNIVSAKKGVPRFDAKEYEILKVYLAIRPTYIT